MAVNFIKTKWRLENTQRNTISHCKTYLVETINKNGTSVAFFLTDATEVNILFGWFNLQFLQ